jgi:hypothetical protein
MIVIRCQHCSVDDDGEGGGKLDRSRVGSSIEHARNSNRVEQGFSCSKVRVEQEIFVRRTESSKSHCSIENFEFESWLLVSEREVTIIFQQRERETRAPDCILVESVSATVECM